MFNWNILIICTVLALICQARDIELLPRPLRSKELENMQDYLHQLKEYHLQNGHRYGKRFSSSITGNIHSQVLPKNWQDVYEAVKQYEDN